MHLGDSGPRIGNGGTKEESWLIGRKNTRRGIKNLEFFGGWDSFLANTFPKRDQGGPWLGGPSFGQVFGLFPLGKDLAYSTFLQVIPLFLTLIFLTRGISFPGPCTKVLTILRSSFLICIWTFLWVIPPGVFNPNFGLTSPKKLGPGV